jgi:hypothetical protein
VLASEADDVLTRVRRIRGIREVVDSLESHPSPGTVPGLQGAPRADPSDRWTPATRAMVSLGAAAVAMPLLTRALMSRRFVAMSPALLAGAIAFTALAVAHQEREARRIAADKEADSWRAEPSRQTGTATW